MPQFQNPSLKILTYMAISSSLKFPLQQNNLVMINRLFFFLLNAKQIVHPIN